MSVKTPKNLLTLLFILIPGLSYSGSLMAQYSNDSAGIQSLQDSTASSHASTPSPRQVYNEFISWDLYYSSNRNLEFFSHFTDPGFQQVVRPNLIGSYSSLIRHLENKKPVRAERILRRLKKVDDYSSEELFVVSVAENLLNTFSES